MITVEELLLRANSKNHFNDEQYWSDLVKDMKTFLNEDHPQEEKVKIGPLGALERANMILSGIRYKKANK